MPWNGSPPNQTFGRTDGTRTGDDLYQQQAAAPVDIEPTLMDIHDTDLKDGIDACLKKDGGNTATADIPMGGFTLTNLGAAGARTEPASFADVQDNKAQYVATVGGTADVITLTPAIAITAYVAGQRFSFIAGGDNTGAVTVNVSGVGAKDVRRNDGSATALLAGDIPEDALVEIEYDGTVFLLLSLRPGILSDLDINGGTAETAPAVADLVPIFDASASANRKMTLANLLKVINLLTAETAPATDDELAVYDTSGSATDKITLADLLKVVNALTEDTMPDNANDFLLSYDASASAAKKVKPSSFHLPGEIVAIIEDQKAQNAAAQSLTANTDIVRELTTLAYNRDTLVSLATNRFTLPAGTWEISWVSPTDLGGGGVGASNQSFLYNQTDSTEVARGTSRTIDGGDNTTAMGQDSSGSAVVTIAGAKAFEIRHRAGGNTIPGGSAANLGTEVYTRVIVRRA